MSLINDIYSIEIDLDSLPYDCPARASDRIRRAWSEGNILDARDLKIILGDSIKGVSIPTNDKEAEEYLRSCLN